MLQLIYKQINNQLILTLNSRKCIFLALEQNPYQDLQLLYRGEVYNFQQDNPKKKDLSPHISAASDYQKKTICPLHLLRLKERHMH